MFFDLSIGDLNSFQMRSVRDAITSLDYSWTLDSVSEVSFQIWDPDFTMLKANYFQVRRDVRTSGGDFEITVVDVSQGPGASPAVKIQARRKAIQLMKRDKNPSALGGGSATDYARAVANNFGLQFVGEPTGTQAVQIQAANEGRADSVWDVLKRNASEAQFAVFESDGTLYFASEQWLLGKWANVQIRWSALPSLIAPFPLYEIPSCRTSDDNPSAAEIRFVVDRNNGVKLRPGMTVDFSGVPTFESRYLITDVAYEEGNQNPVGMSARTPVKPEPRST
jgi:hypothetical protein